MEPRFVVRAKTSCTHGKWRTLLLVVDTTTDTVRATFHSRPAAEDWCNAMNGSQVEQGVA
jgi:hypothetical protein